MSRTHTVQQDSLQIVQQAAFAIIDIFRTWRTDAMDNDHDVLRLNAGLGDIQSSTTSQLRRDDALALLRTDEDLLAGTLSPSETISPSDDSSGASEE